MPLFKASIRESLDDILVEGLQLWEVYKGFFPPWNHNLKRRPTVPFFCVHRDHEIIFPSKDLLFQWKNDSNVYSRKGNMLVLGLE